MEYRFTHRYTYADTLVWGVEIRNLLMSMRSRKRLEFVALAVQLLLWVPIFVWLDQANLNAIGTAVLAFVAIFMISRLFEHMLLPWCVRFLEKRSDGELPEEYECVIDVTDKGITSTQAGQTIHHDWSSIYAVHSTGNNVILISDTIHPIVPSKCFKTVIDEDAFVRACEGRIRGYNSTTPEAFS